MGRARESRGRGRGAFFSLANTVARVLPLLVTLGSVAEDEGGNSQPLLDRHSILLLRPLNGSCLHTADGNAIALAFTSAIFELSPSAAVHFSINGQVASKAVLEQSRPTDQNVKLTLPWLADGRYLVDVMVTSMQSERVLSRLVVEFEVDAGGNCQHWWGHADEGMQKYSATPWDSVDRCDGCGKGEEGVVEEVGLAGTAQKAEGERMRMSCNVALLKPAMQSSTHEDYTAEHAVNGMTGVGRDEFGASTARTEKEGKAWWMVDLGGDRKIVEVLVHREMLTRGMTNSGGDSLKVPDYPQVAGDSEAAKLRVGLYSQEGVLNWKGLIERGRDAKAFDLNATVSARFVKVEAVCDEPLGGGCVLGLSEVLVMEEGCWECEAHCINGQCGGKGNDVCLCDADWFGQDCSHRMMTSVSYLPTKQQHSAWGRHQARKWLEGNGMWKSAMSMIERHQAPADCNMKTTKVLHCPHAGLASSLHAMAGHVSLGIKHGFSAVASTQQPFEYALDHPTCMSRDYTCYFRHWSSCSPYGLDPDALPDTHSPFYYVPEDEVEHFLHVPDQFSSRGVFWWRLATVAYVASINQQTLDAMALSSIKAKLNYTHPIIGMHVRRGDSCHTTSRRGKCVSVDQHISHAKHLSVRYGISKIFLASDDPDALQMVREGLPGVTVIAIDSYDREQLQSGDQVWLEQRLAQGQLPAHQLALFTLTDLLLLAEADAFVLQFASNLSRMAYMLSLIHPRHVSASMGGELGVFAPFVSVDGPWCYHWRMCCMLSSSWPHSRVC